MYNLNKEKLMSQTKTKKPVKAAARTPSRKGRGQVTQADINRNFERIQKAQEGIQKAQEEMIKDHDTLMKDQDALMKRQDAFIKWLQQSFGGLTKSIGGISESMLIPHLVEKFKELGFEFEIINRRRKITNDEHGIYTEIDAFIENTIQAMAVEVKTTLRHDEVDYHVERMEKIRRHADLHNDKRQFWGAMAANIIDDDTRRYALKQGFYIIEPSGEDVKIVKPASVKVW